MNELGFLREETNYAEQQKRDFKEHPKSQLGCSALTTFEREILKDNREMLHLLHRILKHLHPFPTTTAGAVQFTGDFTMQINDLVLNAGQSSQAVIVPLETDGVTDSNGAVSGVSFNFSDPSATVVLNADGISATVKGVAASTGKVSGSVSYSVTDLDQSVSIWNIPFTITVNAGTPPPPTQLTQGGQVQFSDPV